MKILITESITLKVLAAAILYTTVIFSQWEVGASYKIKKDNPEKGMGIYISRNLPFQRALFGIKARAEVNLFRQSETDDETGRTVKRNYLMEDYYLNLSVNFFLKHFTPYAGFGFGFGQTGINHLSKGSSFLILLIGTAFQFCFINPYLEIQGINYFSDPDTALSPGSDSSFHLRWVVGLGISLDTL